MGIAAAASRRCASAALHGGTPSSPLEPVLRVPFLGAGPAGVDRPDGELPWPQAVLLADLGRDGVFATSTPSRGGRSSALEIFHELSFALAG